MAGRLSVRQSVHPSGCFFGQFPAGLTELFSHSWWDQRGRQIWVWRAAPLIQSHYVNKRELWFSPTDTIPILLLLLLIQLRDCSLARSILKFGSVHLVVSQPAGQSVWCMDGWKERLFTWSGGRREDGDLSKCAARHRGAGWRMGIVCSLERPKNYRYVLLWEWKQKTDVSLAFLSKSERDLCYRGPFAGWPVGLPAVCFYLRVCVRTYVLVPAVSFIIGCSMHGTTYSSWCEYSYVP